MDQQTASPPTVLPPEVTNQTKPRAMPDAIRAKLYRKRKKEAGLRCVKSFLPREEFLYLSTLCDIHGQTISDIIAQTISCAMHGQPMPLVPVSALPPGTAPSIILVGK